MKLDLNHVSKHYDKKILNDLDLHIDDVHSIGIIGASGCGKSTLLRLLSGLEFPEEGSILFNDQPLTPETADAFQQQLGFVFQKHNLFPHLTLKANISLILNKIKKQSKQQAEQIADYYLAQVRLTDQANKLPKHVSGGQAQRASIARALSTNPNLMFLDEPTAALDPVLTREVVETITALKHSGKEFIFVTHLMGLLRNFADYFIFMNEGQIIEFGPIGKLEQPQTELLCNFLKMDQG